MLFKIQFFMAQNQLGYKSGSYHISERKAYKILNTILEKIQLPQESMDSAMWDLFINDSEKSALEKLTLINQEKDPLPSNFLQSQKDALHYLVEQAINSGTYERHAKGHSYNINRKRKSTQNMSDKIKGMSYKPELPYTKKGNGELNIERMEKSNGLVEKYEDMFDELLPLKYTRKQQQEQSRSKIEWNVERKWRNKKHKQWKRERPTTAESKKIKHSLLHNFPKNKPVPQY